MGTNLHHAFETKGIKTELIHARPLTDPTAERSYSNAVRLPQADIYIYAIADQALRDVISVIHAPKALHLHTSGTMPIDVFGEDKPHAGVLYFFQSFSRTKMIDDWSSIPCFIEGKNIDDVAAIYSLAQNLTGHNYGGQRWHVPAKHDRYYPHTAQGS